MRAPVDQAAGVSEGGPRFLVDAMLGNVARDLRLLGYDAAFAGAAPDASILRQCQAEGRVLLTRDRALAARARSLPCLLLTETGPEEQVREVLSVWGRTPPPRPFTRCLACNGALAAIAPEEASRSVPDHVAHVHVRFLSCPECGRAYWDGSHGERLRARVRHLSGSLHPRGRPV